MHRRMKSLELMKELQPLTQLGVISAVQAKEIVNGYVSGSVDKLRELIYSPTVPVSVTPILTRLSNFMED